MPKRQQKRPTRQQKRPKRQQKVICLEEYKIHIQTLSEDHLGYENIQYTEQKRHKKAAKKAKKATKSNLPGGMGHLASGQP